MVLKLSTVPSGCSSSALSMGNEYRPCLPSNLLACPVIPSGTDFSIQNRCWLQPLHFGYHDFNVEQEADLDLEDDDFSEGSSVSSDGASSFDTRSICSIPNEVDSLNERRREMLRVSISKIQTMNSSNVFVSLRKSLLIFNTMKSLQRELDECGEDVYSSLMEGNEEASGDDNMFEEGDNDAGIWDFERDIPEFRDRIPVDRPACGDNELPVHFHGTAQDLDLFGGALPTVERGPAYNGGNFWQSNGSSFIDDYLGMLDAWDNADYNPLNNCNLSDTEILHMFGPSLDRAGTQLLSLA